MDEPLQSGYEVSTDPRRVDVDLVHRWLSLDAYWAMGRSREVVAATLAGSQVWSVFAPDGGQVAFTRAVTDGVTFAWICDVYVDRAHRGKGVGESLVRAVVGDLRGRGVRRLVLATRDAHELYRRVGFTVPREGHYMEIDDRPVATELR